MLRKV